jgi:hypothetical protein
MKVLEKVLGLGIIVLLLFLPLSACSYLRQDCSDALQTVDELAVLVAQARDAVETSCASDVSDETCDQMRQLLHEAEVELAEWKGFAICVCELNESEVEARVEAAQAGVE